MENKEKIKKLDCSLDELIQNVSDANKKIICQRCKEVIFEPDFIFVRGEIIKRSKMPNIFGCAEQIFNYAQGIVLHTYCWIATLREYGVELYDLSKVLNGVKFSDSIKEDKNGVESK